MMKNILVLFASVLLLFSACKTRKLTQEKPFGKDPALENRRWVVQEMEGKAIRLPEGSKDVFLSFRGADNTFNGMTSCNEINGMYTTQDSMIFIHKMAMTEMACADMSIEQEFVKVLGLTNRYAVEKKMQKGVQEEYLLLFKDDERIARLKAVWLE